MACVNNKRYVMTSIKFLLFGTGDYYERYKKWFRHEDVLALLDNSPAKQNSMIDGIRVLPPAEGVRLSYDVIVILSFYVKSMRRQLVDLGVPENKIYHFYDLHRLIYKKEFKRPVQYYGDAEKVVELPGQSGKKILLLSQDLTLGGPAIALFHAAEILVKRGYQVVYASMIDGPLREKLLANNIPVIVDVNLQIETMEDSEWTRNFSLLFCNTINYHVFLSERDIGMPVIWWLHDSEFFYDGVNRETLENLDRENLRVCSVGPVPRNAMHKIIPDMPVDDLLYGVEDMVGYVRQTQGRCADKIYFVSIGYIEERKGQDLLVQAIQRLPDEYRAKAVFYLVGQDSSMMAQQIKAQIENMPEIIMTGTVDRDGIKKILNNADVMICPSREDPMPTVVTEAMMYSVPCILSDAAGTAEYIRDGADGFIFPSESVEELSVRIQWCIDHNQELSEMGTRARQIYEKVFSMKVFEENLLDIVNEVEAD